VRFAGDVLLVGISVGIVGMERVFVNTTWCSLVSAMFGQFLVVGERRMGSVSRYIHACSHWRSRGLGRAGSVMGFVCMCNS